MVELDKQVAIAADYYQKETGMAANEEKCDFFRKTFENGLTIDEIMAAVDKVNGREADRQGEMPKASRRATGGEGGLDHWDAIQTECRRIWKEMKKRKAAPE